MSPSQEGLCSDDGLGLEGGGLAAAPSQASLSSEQLSLPLREAATCEGFHSAMGGDGRSRERGLACLLFEISKINFFSGSPTSCEGTTGVSCVTHKSRVLCRATKKKTERRRRFREDKCVFALWGNSRRR